VPGLFPPKALIRTLKRISVPRVCCICWATATGQPSASKNTGPRLHQEKRMRRRATRSHEEAKRFIKEAVPLAEPFFGVVQHHPIAFRTPCPSQTLASQGGCNRNPRS